VIVRQCKIYEIKGVMRVGCPKGTAGARRPVGGGGGEPTARSTKGRGETHNIQEDNK
jgi:hypothetical protein